MAVRSWRSDMLGMIGAILIGGGTGFAAERLNFVRNGVVVSVALGIGGAVGLWFLQGLFGIGLGFGRILTSIIGAAALLLFTKLRK